MNFGSAGLNAEAFNTKEIITEEFNAEKFAT